jgi:hypothetical protein
MLNRYLKQAPTLIVIVVTGLAAWPALFPEGSSSPSKGATQAPSLAQRPAPVVGDLGRDPFQDARLPEAKATLAATSAASAKATASKAGEPGDLSTFPADENEVLAGMKLGGTYIAGREQIAIIDDKIYARGDQLRKADGSPLPYMIAAVRKDHAVLRRGGRDFVLGFSNVPGVGVPRVVEAPALASSATPANGQPAPKLEIGLPKKHSSTNHPGGNTNDPQAAMLLQLLSSLGGASGSGGALNLSALAGLLGGASGTSLGSAGSAPINQDTIQAGIDAMGGKYDNIGREGSAGAAP